MTYRIILVFLTIMFFACASQALEEVRLDLGYSDFFKYDTGKLNYENQKQGTDDEENYLRPSIQTLKKMFDEDFQSENKEPRDNVKFCND